MLCQELFVPLSGINLFVKKLFPGETVDAELPVMVFLHEGLGSVNQWKDFPEKIVKATGFPAIVYDRLGYGKSSPLLETRGLDYIHKEEKLLNQLLAALHIKSYFLVGHSEGGSLALIHAAQHPKGLLKTVTLSANTMNEAKIKPSILEVVKTYEKQDSKLKTALQKYHGDKTDSVFYAWSKTWTADFFSQWNIIEALKQIEVPLLAFHGRNDQYTSLQQIGNISEFVSAPKTIHVLDQCSHHPHFDHEETVIKAMKEFFERVND